MHYKETRCRYRRRKEGGRGQWIQESIRSILNEAMFSLGPGRGESGLHFILHRVWKLLVTAACTKTGKRLIRTSKALFALLKVINHCGHGGLVPRVLRRSAECVGISVCAAICEYKNTRLSLHARPKQLKREKKTGHDSKENFGEKKKTGTRRKEGKKVGT